MRDDSGYLERDLHFAQGNAVAAAQGVERIGGDALAVDYAAVHGVEVFEVEMVAVARKAKVTARHSEVKATVGAEVNVGVAVALGVRASHYKFVAVGYLDGSRGWRLRYYERRSKDVARCKAHAHVCGRHRVLRIRRGCGRGRAKRLGRL